MRQRRHVTRTVPCRPYAELLGKDLQLARGRDAADLTKVNPDVVDQSLGDQESPLGRIVEKLALRQRRRGFRAQLTNPFAFFQSDRIFEKEQVVLFQFASEPDRFDGFQPAMHVMAQRDVKANSAANTVEQLERFAHVLSAVEIDTVRGALGRARRCTAIAASSVAAALTANVRDALLAVLLDVLAQLIQVTPISMPIDGHAFATLAAKELEERHIRHLALDVPQGHIDAGDRVVLDRTIAPVSVLMHQLPEFFDRFGIPTDQERPEILLDQTFDRDMPVSKGRAAESIQAILVGLKFHDNQVDAFRRGQDDFYIGNQGCHFLICQNRINKAEPHRALTYLPRYVRRSESGSSRFTRCPECAGTVIIRMTARSRPAAMKIYEAAGLPVTPFR